MNRRNMLTVVFAVSGFAWAGLSTWSWEIGVLFPYLQLETLAKYNLSSSVPPAWEPWLVWVIFSLLPALALFLLAFRFENTPS